MKNWNTLEPDKVRIMNKHFTPGRGGQRITHIVRHHNAGVLTTEQCWEVWQDRPASAHYQVEVDGTIGQLVWDRDTAWHAADATANAKSIAIEHANSGGQAQGWPISDATIEEGAHLAAALCVHYSLGRPEFGRNIRDHREFHGTSCPHHLAKGGKYHERWMTRAQYWYDKMTNKNTKEETDMSFTPMHADALNEAKVASWKARDNSADNRTQLRGPGDQGWDVAALVEAARKRDGGLGKGTLVELLAVSIQEQRALAAEVKNLRADVAALREGKKAA